MEFFFVEWSKKAREKLKDASKEMSQWERAKFGETIRLVDDRLHKDPLSFGYNYETHGVIKVYLASQSNLALDFSVDVSRRFVNVRDCRRLFL